MATKVFYKIVEKKEDDLFTLFHGINGTRKLPKNKWITGCIKEGVMDGKGTKYTSGIHIIDGYDEALDYLKRFRKNNRVIVPVHAKNLRPKSHSRHKVFLAEKIKIIV